MPSFCVDKHHNPNYAYQGNLNPESRSQIPESERPYYPNMNEYDAIQFENNVRRDTDGSIRTGHGEPEDVDRYVKELESRFKK